MAATAASTGPPPIVTKTSPSSSSSSSYTTADRVKSANWNGSIPVVLSLAPTSLSSPTIPSPIHTLVNRHSFLHIGLRSAVFRLQDYAPPTISFPTVFGGSGTKLMVVEEPEPGRVSQDEEDQAKGEDGSSSSSPEKGDMQHQPQQPKKQKDQVYPVCWFEDEASGLPLRWHLFTGILFDSCSSAAMGKKQRDGGGHGEDDETFLPWKIRLHFTSYPSTQLLELGNIGGGDAGNDAVLTVVERTFKNSLKQALFLQHGNSKVAMNMTKQAHGQLWDSIVTSKYALYRQVNAEYLQPTKHNVMSTVQLIPIRILVDSKPALQKKCSAEEYGETLTLGGLFCQWVPEYFEQIPTTNNEKIGEEDPKKEEEEEDGENDKTRKLKTEIVVQPKDPFTISWHVAGIVPPLSVLVMDLWRALSHPDHFLYIVLTTTNS